MIPGSPAGRGDGALNGTVNDALPCRVDGGDGRHRDAGRWRRGRGGRGRRHAGTRWRRRSIRRPEFVNRSPSSRRGTATEAAATATTASRPGLEQDPAFGVRFGHRRPLRPRPPRASDRRTRSKRPRHEQAAGPRDGQRHPADGIRQVRTVVERARRPGGGQPEHQRQDGATDGGHTERETRQRAQADRDLGHGDEQADRDGERLGKVDEAADRRVADEGGHLAVDRRRARRVEEGRVEQLVEAGVQERETEEDPEREQGGGPDRQGPHPLPERRIGRLDDRVGPSVWVATTGRAAGRSRRSDRRRLIGEPDRSVRASPPPWT